MYTELDIMAHTSTSDSNSVHETFPSFWNNENFFGCGFL